MLIFRMMREKDGIPRLEIHEIPSVEIFRVLQHPRINF